MKLLARALIISVFLSLNLKAQVELQNTKNRESFRFEMGNDIVFDDDSQFTNAWSIQYFSKSYNNWEDTSAPEWIKSIGISCPGLNSKDRVLRYGHGIGQLMVTPGDLTAKEPHPDEIPYAGTMTYSFLWQSFNEKRGNSLQVTLGIMGELSLAEEFQKFVHNDLNRGDDPQGWHTQREDEPIFNLAYKNDWRLAHIGTYENDWAAQIEFSQTMHIGNLYTAAEADIAIRAGWNISKGFNSYPVVPGLGVFNHESLPKSQNSSRYGIELFAAFKYAYMPYSVIYDGSFISNDDRDVERRNDMHMEVFGCNLHIFDSFTLRLAIVHASDLLKDTPIPEDESLSRTEADNSYGSFTVEYNF